jgi:hypothetical protein
MASTEIKKGKEGEKERSLGKHNFPPNLFLITPYYLSSPILIPFANYKP